ncbi:MAG: hypothetical protein KDE46_14810, partial [Caldilineaceae bacterium]|nr:hypothetical protein [Caldilineaceae bacterium]
EDMQNLISTLQTFSMSLHNVSCAMFPAQCFLRNVSCAMSLHNVSCAMSLHNVPVQLIAFTTAVAISCFGRDAARLLANCGRCLSRAILCHPMGRDNQIDAIILAEVPAWFAIFCC